MVNIDKNLENLIKTSLKAQNLYERARASPNKSNVQLRKEARDFYNQYILQEQRNQNPIASLDEVQFVETLEAGRNKMLTSLTELAKDDKIYEKSIGDLKSGLKEKQIGYYMSLIQNGIVPKEKSKALNKVIEIVGYYTTLAAYWQRGDNASMSAAEELINSTMRGKGEVLELKTLYKYEDPKTTIKDIIEIQSQMAMGIMDRYKLAAEIDKGISENSNGRAIALLEAYKANLSR